MQNFITNGIAIFLGQIETADIKEKLNDIQKETARLKNDVNEFIKDNYIDFVPRLTKDPVLIDSAEKLIREMETLRSRIETQVCINILFHFTNKK